MGIKVDTFTSAGGGGGETGGLVYKGAFDASTGLPSIANAEQGDFYVIDTAGTIYGQDWNVGDHLLINEDMGGSITNSKIDKIDNTETPASETVAGVIEIATNVEATAASETNKALVPSNISSIALSSFNDDLSYLSSGDNISLLNNNSGYITNINSESLNDLSDVSYTAGAGIDNYVLTYDHATTSWGAEAAAGGGLAAVVDDTTPQLGGSLDVNGHEITSASSGNVVINPDGTGDISIGADLIPDADVTHTIGDENNRYISYYGDMNGAIRFKAKNDQGTTINKGQVVYISGVSGTVPQVRLARANSATTMPAFGLAFASANDQADIEIVTFGNLTDYDTTTYSLSANDTVFVSAATAGALTNSAPTSETNLIQNIGRVVRADASAGIIKVGGAGRSNATPNLNQDKIFLGNASNQAVSTALSSIALSSFNDDLSYLSSGDNVSLLTNDAGYLTSVSSASETVEGIIETATNLEAQGASATNKALVPSNISSIALSSFNDDLSYLSSGDNISLLTNNSGYISNINSESLNDLSDVSYTAGAGIDNYVLTYDHSTTSWGAEAAASSSEWTIESRNDSQGNFTAQVGYYYLVNNTNTGTALRMTLPGASVGDRIRVFNYGAGTLEVRDSGSSTELDPNDGTTGFQDYKLFDQNCIIDIVMVASGDYEWVVSPQIEIEGQGALTTSGQVLYYDASTNKNQLSALPYVFPTADGSNLQILQTNGSGALSFVTANVSDFTNDSGYLTNINSESIGDLSDVTITAAASGEYLRHNGLAWVDTALSVADDTTPQLGGNLDTNGNELVTASNANLVLRPNGTGHVFLGGNTNPAELRLYCESADAHYVGFKSPTHAEMSTNPSVTWRLPITDAATSGDALVSDGSGNLSFTTISGGYTFSAITANTTAQIEYHYSCDTSGGAFTLTLPALSGVTAGQEIRVKLATAGNDLTIAVTGTDTIDDLGSYTLSVAKSSITLVANTSATDWEII